ncbi:hypothetical protein N656DRAFT_784122 [Canariomyces notabilis]|uniref:MADS-box domain-containing protein n=1 Tax=Canariomyces notabilis TaxID=2074819 RepID=A0AAN6T8N6_9PEZI|nr:hypothetical protein N656DRAFT_784122 [Canariomyces arenarius]
MPAPKSTTGQPVRKWAGRTQGVQKKFHEIHWLFGAVTAVVVLKDDELHVYESKPGWVKGLPAVKTTFTTTPENLLTREDQARGPPTRKDPNKAWNGRTLNAMKKAHQIHTLYGAQTAGLIFNKETGELMIYESRQNLVGLPDGVNRVRRIPRERFTWIRDKQKPTTAGPWQGRAPASLRPGESDVLDSFILDSCTPAQPTPAKAKGILRLGEYFSI